MPGRGCTHLIHRADRCLWRAGVQTSTGATEEVHRRPLGGERDAGEAAALVACTHAALKPLHAGLWAVDQRSPDARAPRAAQRRKRTTVNRGGCANKTRAHGLKCAPDWCAWCGVVLAVSLAPPPPPPPGARPPRGPPPGGGGGGGGHTRGARARAPPHSPPPTHVLSRSVSTIYAPDYLLPRLRLTKPRAEDG